VVRSLGNAIRKLTYLNVFEEKHHDALSTCLRQRASAYKQLGMLAEAEADLENAEETLKGLPRTQ
jgi:Arc/MetJ family transcription regulator